MKKYWIGKLDCDTYELLRSDTRPKRFRFSNEGGFDWNYPTETIASFCAKEFERHTGLKLKAGGSVRVTWKFGKVT